MRADDKATRKFLDSRTGADNSDIEALMHEFELSEREAGRVYRDWLDSLDVEREQSAA